MAVAVIFSLYVGVLLLVVVFVGGEVSSSLQADADVSLTRFPRSATLKRDGAGGWKRTNEHLCRVVCGTGFSPLLGFCPPTGVFSHVGFFP